MQISQNQPQVQSNTNLITNSTDSRNRKIIIFTILFMVFSIIVISIIFIFSLDSDKEPVIQTDENNENNGEYINEPDKNGRKSPDNRTYISDPNYPFDLPEDAPFDFDEMENLYVEGEDRYVIMYTEAGDNSEEKFKSEIDPYVKLYIASSEYYFQKYDHIFRGNNPRLSDRELLAINAYEVCTDISSELDETTCNDIKMIGIASPFTFTVNFFINRDHPDFKSGMIITTATHETIHLLQYTYDSGYAGSLIPDWYKESMAVALEYNPDIYKEQYPELFINFEYPSTLEELSEMITASNDSVESVNNKRRAYSIAGDFFNFLMTKTSLEEYLPLIPMKTSEFDNEFERDFTDIFGKDMEGMYSEFLSSIE